MSIPARFRRRAALRGLFAARRGLFASCHGLFASCRGLLAAACVFGTLAPVVAVTGCGARGPRAGEFTATPVYSTRERFGRIGRNIDLELKMMNDDIDRALLLREASLLSEWSVP